jgi:acyl dehydratase
MRLLVESGLPIGGGIIGADGEITWPKVRPGAVLHVESEILEVRQSRSRPDRGVVTVRSETGDQVGERPGARRQARRAAENTDVRDGNPSAKGACLKRRPC